VTNPFGHLPSFGRYRVVEADPPWKFASWSHRGEGRGASQHYDLMELDAIKALPVSTIAGPDAALFLWVVQPLLFEAREVIRAWEFEYKTIAFAWVKTKTEPGALMFWDEAWSDGLTRKGLGYHTRAGMELCLLATRGKGYERLSKGVGQVVHAPLRQHSRKPDEIAAAIAKLADGPRASLFARTRHGEFDCWGNQVGKFGGGSTVAGPAPIPAPDAPAAGLGSLGAAAGVAAPAVAPPSDDDLLEIPAFLRRDPVTGRLLGVAG